MSLYLNTNAAFKDFQMLRNDKFFVDKSSIIEKAKYPAASSGASILKRPKGRGI